MAPGRNADGKTQCYYETLAVERTASDDELKKAYRKMALLWHPDKNQHRVDEATEMFKVIQHAYLVLSDAQERAWYDRHRDQVLRGKSTSAGAAGAPDYDDGPDIFEFFSAGAYSGFGGDEDGFYAVYASLFAELDELEREQGEDDADAPAKGRGAKATAAPSFGTAGSEWADVRDFYNQWFGFATRRPFYSKDKWDLRDAPNRHVRRAMEKENKKERSVARKEHTANVRELVEFVRKRDKRVQAHTAAMDVQAREKEVALRTRRVEEQRAYDTERSRMAEELAAEDDSEMVERLQAAVNDLGLDGRKGRKKGKNGKNGADDSPMSQAATGGAAI